MPAFAELFKGDPVIGTFLTFQAETPAYIMAGLNFQFLIIDGEHAPIASLTMTRLVHAIGNGSHGKVAALVRVPAHGVEWIKW